MNMIAQEGSLTSAEQKRLSELEGVIKENFLAYVAVGNALLEIRENRLYRNREGRTWEKYCRTIWDMSHRRADQLIMANSVAENLGTVVPKNDGTPDWQLLPANESQARELAELAPEAQRKVWRDLIEGKRTTEYTGKTFRLTAKEIRDAVNKYRGELIVKCAEEAAAAVTNPSLRSNYNKSEPFASVFSQFVTQIANEAKAQWRHTSRQVAFDALCTLTRTVGESGVETLATKGIVWRGDNAQKLLAAGFSIFRIAPGNLRIERLAAVDQWMVFGEYQTQGQCVAAFHDLMLDSANFQGE